MSQQYQPLTLLILDGWGYREQTEHNAIAAAHTPNWHYLWQHYPHTLLTTSGKSVGLPDGQMGNSEVGHLNLGAGRLVPQDFTRITAAIEDGSFFTNPTLTKAIQLAIQQKKALHILGLLSPGGIHSHEDHLIAMLQMAAQLGAPSIYLHAILDGRDTPPQSARSSVEKAMAECQRLGSAQIASLIGRYYAMDRDKRWERTQSAYDLLTLGKANVYTPDPLAGLAIAYQNGDSDEFVKPIAIHAPHASPITIQDGDVVIAMNFRADRARQLSYALTSSEFTDFPRLRWPQLGAYVSLTEYAPDITDHVAYPTLTLNNHLGEWLAKHELPQLRIAETEKYAHVTFFFNGGQETPFPGEERILVPSPQVATYDLQPEMSALTVTDKLIKAILSQRYALIVCNFANPDMVGHTGNFAATVKAIETIDQCIGQIVTASQQVGGEVVITADHGNAEKMFDWETNQPHTAHTLEPVPFLYIGNRAQIDENVVDKKLSDVAPSLLYLLHLEKPKEMTGQSFLK